MHSLIALLLGASMTAPAPAAVERFARTTTLRFEACALERQLYDATHADADAKSLRTCVRDGERELDRLFGEARAALERAHRADQVAAADDARAATLAALHLLGAPEPVPVAELQAAIEERAAKLTGAR